MICILFFYFLSFSAFSMEIQNFELPDTTEEIEAFSRKKLKSYIKYYQKEKKDGILYYNSILKAEHDDSLVSCKQATPQMLNYWYLHEIFMLEKKRRTKRSLKGRYLGEFLQNIDLIPWKVRKHIDFPKPETPRTFTARKTRSDPRLTWDSSPVQAYDHHLGWQN